MGWDQRMTYEVNKALKWSARIELAPVTQNGAAFPGYYPCKL